jgi:hypothetical protein
VGVSLLRIIAEGRDSLEFSNLALGSSWIVISNIGKDKSIADDFDFETGWRYALYNRPSLSKCRHIVYSEENTGRLGFDLLDASVNTLI